MKRTIGERLKKARKDAKIRQGAAAEKMEMSRTTLSAIESDKRLVWAEEITKFAEMYKVSANELLYGFADEFPEIAYSARTAHPFQRNGAPFRFKLSKAQQVD